MFKYQKYNSVNSVNTLRTQEIISQHTQNHCEIVRNKKLQIETCSIKYMYRQNSDLPCLKMKTLAGKHVETDQGQLAT